MSDYLKKKKNVEPLNPQPSWCLFGWCQIWERKRENHQRLNSSKDVALSEMNVAADINSIFVCIILFSLLHLFLFKILPINCVYYIYTNLEWLFKNSLFKKKKMQPSHQAAKQPCTDCLGNGKKTLKKCTHQKKNWIWCHFLPLKDWIVAPKKKKASIR